MFDFLIRDVSILDGSGGPAFLGNLAIAGGRIVAIGDVEGEATRAIDGRGLVATPGFIDMHSHTDGGLLVDPTAQSKITQGITLEVCGQCGFSSAPCLDDAGRADLDSWRDRYGIGEDWRSMGEFLSIMESRPIGVNFITLIGHSNVRAAVVGLADREASPAELEQMQGHVRDAMEQGAFGVSSGLIYPPSCFGSTAELVALAEAASPYGGYYSSHIRSERDAIVDAVEEAIEIGRRGGVPVQIAHHKGCGRNNWGKVRTTLAAVREACEAGVDVTVDQYPYTASATSLSIFLPHSAHDGGDDALLRRLRENRDEMLAHLDELNEPGGLVANDGGWSSVVISSVRTEENRRFEGMNLIDIAEARALSPEETVLALLTEESASVSMVHFAQCEEDIRIVMTSDFAMFGTDASARGVSGPFSKGKPHPRSFGSFPRVLGRYVREQSVISLPTAIRKMTSDAARKLGLADRGLLREGNWADVVVLDPDKVIDRATYENPHQISEGIRFVFVNGALSVEDGELTGALAGRVLRRNSAASGRVM